MLTVILFLSVLNTIEIMDVCSTKSIVFAHKKRKASYLFIKRNASYLLIKRLIKNSAFVYNGVNIYLIHIWNSSDKNLYISFLCKQLFNYVCLIFFIDYLFITFTRLFWKRWEQIIIIFSLNSGRSPEFRRHFFR